MSTEPSADQGATAGPDEVAAGPVRPSRSLTPLVVLVALGVWVVDQLSKLLIVHVMPTREHINIVGSWLTITYTRNPGAAFSSGTGTTWIFTLIAVAVAVVVVAIQSPPGFARVGGLPRRAARWCHGQPDRPHLSGPAPVPGHVVDFIHPQHFAVFNLADAAITCSAIGMVALVRSWAWSSTATVVPTRW